jgi:hypothetical protein
LRLSRGYPAELSQSFLLITLFETRIRIISAVLRKPNGTHLFAEVRERSSATCENGGALSSFYRADCADAANISKHVLNW